MPTNTYPPPIRLAELVALVGVDGVHTLAQQIGAIEIAPKPNQLWRMVLDSAIIIGYAGSVVVAGRDELLMRLAAARLTLAGGLADDALRHQLLVMDLAVDARMLMTPPHRGAPADRQRAWYDHVRSLLTRCHDLDEDVFRALHAVCAQVAPDAWDWLEFVLTVYAWGVDDALDDLAPDADDVWLPDMPTDPPGHTALSA